MNGINFSRRPLNWMWLSGLTPQRHFTACRKISYRVFIDLFDNLCVFINRHAPLVTYQGLRVFVIDPVSPGN